jgi:flagellar protein FlgJ
MNPIGGGPTPAQKAMPLATPSVSDDARLKKTASQLEAVFVQRMFAAMRDTVPDGGGMVEQSSAEQTFTSMMDEKMSEKVPTQMDGEHSLSHALYNQLKQRLVAQGAPAIPNAQSLQNTSITTTTAVSRSQSPK